MSSTSPSTSVYPLPAEVFGSGYRYEEPPQPAESIPYISSVSEQLIGAAQTPPTSTKRKADAKPRLRKACDGCSVRKVKCDESGPPCKSCAALDIPCTFERPSRRRGPPNRVAEAIKRQRLEDGATPSSVASPTRDAALSLAALRAPSSLSAESICDLQTLEMMVDDYFIYIHPLIPVPHEPTFREQFARREDRTDRSFLALLAAMIEALVVSYPRRPRQLFTSDQARQQFPNAGALIDRCHQVYVEARGAGFMDRDMKLFDACGSYFVGLAAAYMFDFARCRLYFAECVVILRILGFHKPEEYQPQNAAPAGSVEAPDFVYQQIGRRLFWLCFVGTMSLRQIGGYDADILIPPMSHAEKLPPLPLEVDDVHIRQEGIFEQPGHELSLLSGFNRNIRIFRAFHNMTALEMAFGADTLFDWDRQRYVIRRALQDVKNITKDLPVQLQVKKIRVGQPGTSPAHDHKPIDPVIHPMGRLSDRPGEAAEIKEQLGVSIRTVQFEIQKANIHATQLATRSYLVERFWNLFDIYDRERKVSINVLSNREVASSSPTVACVTAGLDERLRQSRVGRTPSDSYADAGEQAMAVEREDIIRDLFSLLSTIDQKSMEPNGLSLCTKIRQVASTLLSQDRSRMSVMPTLDAESVHEYLEAFCQILARLERLGSDKIRGVDASDNNNSNNNGSGSGLDFATNEEIEEEELVQWASLKKQQERFVMKNEGYFGSV